ncbi:superoxide dismutase [Candidatus Gracilibacteria bacterium]|nr:superoxide dismutase [Candidatus Gracilibacteria bacterium]
MSFQLPALEYAYDALEPHIDEQTMRVHYTKHHQAYTDNANKSVAGTPWADKSVFEILTNLDSLPVSIRSAARNNVGGYCNHSFFWTIVGPDGGGFPMGKLGIVIQKQFGSFEKFKTEFEKASLGQFGSGWAWLVVKNGKLEIVSTANQDSVITLIGKDTRIIGLDVWEHAYYLKYQNRRADYINAFWNVVRWDRAEENYKKAIA